MRNKIIFIGSGIGSLTCAYLLAKRGFQVTIFEKNSFPGGYCSGIMEDGFYFDIGPQKLNPEIEKNFIRDLIKDIPGSQNINFLDFSTRIKSPDYEISLYDKDQAVKQLIELFPDEKGSLEKYFLEMSNQMIPLDWIEDNINQRTEKTIDWKIVFEMRKQYPYFFQRINQTNRMILDEYFGKNDRLLSLMYGMQGGMINDHAIASTAKCPIYGSFCSTNEEFINSVFYYPLTRNFRIEGGNRNLINILLRGINLENGKIIYNTKVRSIAFEAETAVGIITENGDFLKADTIVSGIDARQTFFTLVGREKLNQSLISRLERWSVRNPSVAVYLGLDLDLSQRGFQGDEILWIPNYDLKNTIYLLEKNELPDRLWLNIYMPSIIDRSLAPKGKSTIICNFYIGKELSYNSRYSEQELREIFYQKTIRELEALIPNISRYISTQRVLLPREFEELTGNYLGSSYGWSFHPRFLKDYYLGNRTQFNHLYMVGHWTLLFRGMTQTIDSGYNTANCILEDHQMNDRLYTSLCYSARPTRLAPKDHGIK